MRRAGLAALRTGVESASLTFEIEIQAMRRHGGIQVLALENPGRCFQTQTVDQNMCAVHAMPPVAEKVMS